jgi:murein DD-endopeptidase MepM/ murein hydrolase activator NlpD
LVSLAFLEEMAITKFNYNSATCRYEPAKISLIQVLLYAVSLLAMGAVLFAGIAFLHGRFFTTQATLALRAENKALQKHYILLNNQIRLLDASLAGIAATQKSIELKIFAEPGVTEMLKKQEYNFPSDAREARQLLHDVQGKLYNICKNAAVSNYRYVSYLNLSAADKAAIAAWPSGQPVSKTHLNVASGFGLRINPFHKGVYQHKGLDFAAPKGTPVYATGQGKIVDTGMSNLEAGYGNFVEIDHGNGIITRYAHLHKLAVNTGQAVKKGTVIGTVGISGGASAPHLHYEIIRNGEQVDPMWYMMDGLTSKQFMQLTKQAKERNQSLD